MIEKSWERKSDNENKRRPGRSGGRRGGWTWQKPRREEGGYFCGHRGRRYKISSEWRSLFTGGLRDRHSLVPSYIPRPLSSAALVVCALLLLSRLPRLLLVYLYINIYIFMCVCVCVYARIACFKFSQLSHLPSWFYSYSRWHKANEKEWWKKWRLRIRFRARCRSWLERRRRGSLRCTVSTDSRIVLNEVVVGIEQNGVGVGTTSERGRQCARSAREVFIDFFLWSFIIFIFSHSQCEEKKKKK